MRASTVSVSRQKGSETLTIQVELGEGETADSGVRAGRAFLAKKFGEQPSQAEVAAARDVIDRDDASQTVL